VRAKFIMTVLNFVFGCLFIDSQGAMLSGRQNGFGGKVGIAVDFYPLKWLALGVGASVDLQGFVNNNSLTGSYGGTFTARAGIHL
jgi:hypothetical protein